MLRPYLAAVLVASSLLATPASAQQCGGAPTLLGLADADAQPGVWAEYVALDEGRPVIDVGFRVFLAEGPVEGKPRRWLEMWLERSGRIALRFGADEPKPTVYLKLGRTIFALPPDDGSMGVGSCRADSAGEQASKPVPFTVLAGTFPCMHTKRVYGKDTSEFWMSQQVPPLQLVKALYPGGRGYELVARGTGAKTVFPERFVAAPLPSGDSIAGLLPRDLRKKIEEHKQSSQAPDAGALPPLKSWGADAGTP